MKSEFDWVWAVIVVVWVVVNFIVKKVRGQQEDQPYQGPPPQQNEPDTTTAGTQQERSSPSSQPPPPPYSQEEGGGQDEIRKFLEELQRKAAPQQPVRRKTPPKLPIPVKKIIQEDEEVEIPSSWKPHVSLSGPEHLGKTDLRADFQASLKEQVEERKLNFTPIGVVAAETRPKHELKSTKKKITLSFDRSSIKQAVVMREILGPPIGLKQL